MEVDNASPTATENIQPVRFLDSDDRLARPTPGWRCVCQVVVIEQCCFILVAYGD
jgi:hypothetical protein